MGRHRRYASNAERQRAYRVRKHPPAAVPAAQYFDVARETDGRSWTLRSFVRDVVGSGISAAFAVKRLNVGPKVIKACLGMLPVAAPGTAVPITKKLGRTEGPMPRTQRMATARRQGTRFLNWPDRP
jgi:hypothetical protein